MCFLSFNTFFKFLILLLFIVHYNDDAFVYLCSLMPYCLFKSGVNTGMAEPGKGGWVAIAPSLFAEVLYSGFGIEKNGRITTKKFAIWGMLWNVKLVFAYFYLCRSQTLPPESPR